MATLFHALWLQSDTYEARIENEHISLPACMVKSLQLSHIFEEGKPAEYEKKRGDTAFSLHLAYDLPCWMTASRSLAVTIMRQLFRRYCSCDAV